MFQGYEDAINGAFGVGNDAVFHAETAIQFLKQWYDIDLSFKLRMAVHYGYEVLIY